MTILAIRGVVQLFFGYNGGVIDVGLAPGMAALEGDDELGAVKGGVAIVSLAYSRAVPVFLP